MKNIIFYHRRAADICEDLELKQRIIEMKDEIESHRATRKRDLVRKRSQNTRRYVPTTGRVFVDACLSECLVTRMSCRDTMQFVMADSKPTLSLYNVLFTLLY